MRRIQVFSNTPGIVLVDLWIIILRYWFIYHFYVLVGILTLLKVFFFGYDTVYI